MALSVAEQTEWLGNDNHRIVLMDLEYYDTSAASVATERFSSYPYVMPIGDIWGAYSDLMYDDIIQTIPNIVTKIDSDSTIGTITLFNTDGEYDNLLFDDTVVGHSIKLYLGNESWVRDNFILILEGVVSSITSTSPSNISITIRDKKEALNVPLQEQLIITNGTDEYWDLLMNEVDALGLTGVIPDGGSGIAYSRALAVLPEATENTHVPICLGRCFNIEPVLVDSFNHVYLIHDSDEGIVSVDEVRANGVVLNSALNTPITGPQQYEVDIGLGIMRLLDHSQGTQITCDVVGQDGPSDLRLGGAPALTPYSAADLLEWILLEKAGILSTEICYETFAPTGSNPFPNTDDLGFYSKSEATVLDEITKIINSVGGFMRFKSSICQLQLYILKDPEGETPDLTLVDDDIVLNGFTILEIEEPKHSITLGYKRNWKTQDEGSLAGSLTDATSPYYNVEVLDSFMNEYSTLYESLGLSTVEYPLAEHIELIETYLFYEADAQDELDRRVILRSDRRRVFKVQSVATSFTYDIGDIVHITHDRFGFSEGKEAMIIGIEESPTRQRVTLEVWL